MKKEIKVILPTIDQADNYFKRNGYPDGMESVGFDIYDCRHGELKEAIINNYDFCDYDRWIAIEKLIKHDISFEDAMRIDGVLFENDIEIFDLI